VEFSYPEAAERVREKVQAFLAEQLPVDWSGLGVLEGDAYEDFVVRWREKLYEGRWLAVAWPEEYGGRGLSEVEQVVVAEELARAGVPDGGLNDAFGISMLGNTLLHFGSDAQKEHFLPRILSGEYTFCQGYSEPNAGSDLANVGTKAVKDGDEWIINGQKIWTSAGHLANWIFVLCRTDQDAPKHRGITFILCPMDQAGVEVRPIRMMSGASEFNEVFFTNARAAAANVVGSVNDGWRVAMSLLGFERGERAAVMPIQFRAELDRLIAMAKETGRADDPLVRDRIAKAFTKVETMRYMGYGALTRFVNGVAPGPDSAITKIYWSEYHREITELAMDILGVRSLVPSGRKSTSVFGTDAPGAPNSTASWQATFLNSRAGTIYAGTSEIQRNIAGEMILGLPKEPKNPR